MKPYIFQKIKKGIVLFFIALLSVECLPDRQNALSNTDNQKVKLVVGIVVDQMRYDFLPLFWDKYGENGFKRMIREGFNCKNTHFNYVPTYTGPGHSSVYTGTTPSVHGIIANNWYDKYEKKMVYCVSDDAFQTVGARSKSGQMSPRRLLVTTLSDQLRMATQMRGKAIGIALKDRAAILPAGHSANAAYWFDGKDRGKWISSTYYMNELPQWVVDFNNSGKAKHYLNTTWETFYDINTYTESIPDKNPYETPFKGKQWAVFPYELSKLKELNHGYDILKYTPYGNRLTTDFAIAALKGEKLGKDNATDFLAISFSSTDYIGHRFGVDSKEVEDAYIRLDRDMEVLLKTLDREVGEGNYIVFLTADHGAVKVPSYLKSIHVPGGYFGIKRFVDTIKKITSAKYGTAAFIENVSNNQIFLDHKKIASLNLDVHQVQQFLSDQIIGIDGVYISITATAMQSGDFNNGLRELMQNGYNQKRSGDVLFSLLPSTIAYSKTGSTHGSGFNYDTHVPLLFMGKGIPHNSTSRYTAITAIVPTIAALLDISYPNGCSGQPIKEIVP